MTSKPRFKVKCCSFDFLREHKAIAPAAQETEQAKSAAFEAEYGKREKTQEKELPSKYKQLVSIRVIDTILGRTKWYLLFNSDKY